MIINLFKYREENFVVSILLDELTKFQRTEKGAKHNDSHVIVRIRLKHVDNEFSSTYFIVKIKDTWWLK